MTIDVEKKARQAAGSEDSAAAARGNTWLRVGFAMLLTSTLAMGCTWVALKPEAEGVRVAASMDAVLGCKQVGHIKAHTKSSVGIFDRSDDTIRSELQSLARNDAASMGANAILAEGPPTMEGEQRFLAYRCPKT